MNSDTPEADALPDHDRLSTDRPHEAGSALPPTAEHLRREAARLLELAGERERAEAAAILVAREARRPKQPEVRGDDIPAVVWFTKHQAGRGYHYAAIGWRVGQSVRWSVTGEETRRFNWPGLLEFIGEANWPSLSVVTASECIGPDLTEEAPVAEVMGRYGRVERTQQLGPLGDPLRGVDMIVVTAEPGLGRSSFRGGGLLDR